MRHLLLACVAGVAVGCGTPSSTANPTVATWTPPADWVTVSNLEDTIQLTLPPWLEVADIHGSIFARQPPADPRSIAVWAQGPAGIEPQPLDGEDLRAWLERRLDDPADGVPAVSRVSLPAGAGIRYDRIDSAGTLSAWRIVVFAIETPGGVAWLQLGGPPASWTAHADALERLALLFRVR